MLIGSRQKLSNFSGQPELSIDNVPVKNVTSLKSLGIFVDENLRWQTHIGKLSKKIASRIGAIKRIREHGSPQTELRYKYLKPRLNKFQNYKY